MSSLPKIVFADRFFMTQSAMKLLESVGEIVLAPEKAEKKLMVKVQGATAIIAEYNRITASVMDAAKGTLKGIVAYGVGYNHIDVSAATERGICVANCKGSNAEAVAELAVTLMLNISRGTHVGDRFIRDGRWLSDESGELPPVLRGRELAHKTLGLVGMGEIGRRVARIAKGFEMRILVFDPCLSPEVARQQGAEPVDLVSLTSQADYVSIHGPLSAETKDLIGEKEISLMKPTAYLINTARGALVDEKALLTALQRKKIAGAALDVFSVEPLPMRSGFLKLDNVILTPHIGGVTEEALAEVSYMSAKEAARIARGEVPVNLVNRKELAANGFLVQRGFGSEVPEVKAHH